MFSFCQAFCWIGSRYLAIDIFSKLFYSQAVAFLTGPAVFVLQSQKFRKTKKIKLNSQSQITTRWTVSITAINCRIIAASPTCRFRLEIAWLELVSVVVCIYNVVFVSCFPRIRYCLLFSYLASLEYDIVCCICICVLFCIFSALYIAFFIEIVFSDIICISPFTLEPHYNTDFGVHSDMSVITEQPYNEGLIHRKYKQWEPCL